MEDFRIIYKILRILQNAMDLEEFDPKELSAEALGLTVPKWSRIMAILLKGYPSVSLTRPELTMKGLEYLEENGLMKKAAGLAKGIIETAL